MGGLSPCPFRDGRGIVTFERAPEVEPCTECRGSGRLYTDAEYRGVFDALLHEKGIFADRDLRLLLLGLSALERRLSELEAKLRP